ncbi:MAG: GntR family transcriptional regulator [Thermodesulfovibrionales bacterium]|nr:GntR family transcriptional regulator [Thermodesulfovibrionales bacterium]
MELIDRDDHQKLYLQVYGIIKKKIETNEWQVGSQIPTEGELCKMFNVSRATVRTAVLELTRQGYLKRQQGKGTFIKRNAFSEGFPMHASMKELLLDYDAEPTSEVLVRTVMMPVDGLDLKLDITPDKHIIYIKKLWKVREESVILQEIYVPYHVCPLLLEDDIEHRSLFDLFGKKYGIRITRVRNYIDITHLTEEQSGSIGANELPALLLTQEFYSGDTIVAYSVSKKRPNRFQIFLELERNVT